MAVKIKVKANDMPMSNKDTLSTPVPVNGPKIKIRVSPNGEKPMPLPKPKWDDPKEVKQKYYNDFYKRYGEYAKERADWGDFLNFRLKRDPNISFKKVFADVGKRQGIRPELLYSSTMEEGMRQMFPNARNSGVGGTDDPNYPIDGFFGFGLDTFSDQYKDLVTKGYLDPKFADRFKPVYKTNEKGERVNSAYFKDMDDAILAKSAMIRSASDDISNWATQNKIPLSDKAKDFFTLVAYNAGMGNAQKMLSSYAKEGFLKDDSFLKKRPSQYWEGPYENVMRRMVMADALKNEQYFD